MATVQAQHLANVTEDQWREFKARIDGGFYTGNEFVTQYLVRSGAYYPREIKHWLLQFRDALCTELDLESEQDMLMKSQLPMAERRAYFDENIVAAICSYNHHRSAAWRSAWNSVLEQSDDGEDERAQELIAEQRQFNGQLLGAVNTLIQSNQQFQQVMMHVLNGGGGPIYQGGHARSHYHTPSPFLPIAPASQHHHDTSNSSSTNISELN
eukprot:CAMPEP_0174971206 /NCGR_PEP_ID=MMETSP0004_2-20121128/9853_1 /TAXON_ID=420556 /ORGANISM="Ochromonas sp., Strain CCMP1393" /LENGTH=210 /DNA_ID=CAMNT_0016221109 /DNA_START=46 /DNA_END=678 /DNA_ORIENTATION=-